MGSRSDLDAVLDAIREASAGDVWDRGNRFERLIAAALTVDPEMGFDQVWMWAEWPGDDGPDLGIDLVARDQSTGELTAVQCKLWTDSQDKSRQGKRHMQAINSFLAASGRAEFANRIYLHTTADLPSFGKDKISQASPPCRVMGLADLAALRVNWQELAEETGVASSDLQALAEQDEGSKSAVAQRSSLPPPPPPVEIRAPQAPDPAEARPSSPTDVVRLADEHFGLASKEVIQRAEAMFGPGKAERSEEDLSRLWQSIVRDQGAQGNDEPDESPAMAALPCQTDLLTGLTEEQVEAVTTTASPLCVIAGAGSGKTRVLTRRIAWQAATGQIDPQNVLAVTFTRRAAGELRRRLRGLGLADEVAAGTFHASALAMLRRYWVQSGESQPRIIQSRMTVLKDLRPDWGWPRLYAVNGEIDWSCRRMVQPEEYREAVNATERRGSLDPKLVAQAYRDYVDAKRDRGVIDFDDMLSLAHQVLAQDQDFAKDQHRRQRHLLVDEFQDVNPLQFELLKAWIGPSSTLVIVGDPRQAIFAWNGAEPDLLVQIERYLPDVMKLSLTTNFRSTPEICTVAGHILDVRPQPSDRPSGTFPVLRELLGRIPPDGDIASHEARTIAEEVSNAHVPGSLWREQAVLARTNAQLEPIREALAAKDIPVRSGATKSVLGLPEVGELLASFEDSQGLSSLVDDLMAEISVTSMTQGQPSANSYGFAAADGSRILADLLECARDLLALDPASTVKDLVQALDSDDGLLLFGDGVDLSTIHKAKGLEWRIVHLVGAEDGYLPHNRSRTGSARKEERRLLYVAATRAEERLNLTWCHLRPHGKGLRRRSLSPWLQEFPRGSAFLRAASHQGGAAQARQDLPPHTPTGSPPSGSIGSTGDRTGNLPAAARRRSRAWYVALAVFVWLLIVAVADGRIWPAVLFGSLTAFLVARAVNDYLDARKAPADRSSTSSSRERRRRGSLPEGRGCLVAIAGVIGLLALLAFLGSGWESGYFADRGIAPVGTHNRSDITEALPADPVDDLQAPLPESPTTTTRSHEVMDDEARSLLMRALALAEEAYAMQRSGGVRCYGDLQCTIEDPRTAQFLQDLSNGRIDFGAWRRPDNMPEPGAIGLQVVEDDNAVPGDPDDGQWIRLMTRSESGSTFCVIKVVQAVDPQFEGTGYMAVHPVDSAKFATSAHCGGTNKYIPHPERPNTACVHGPNGPSIRPDNLDNLPGVSQSATGCWTQPELGEPGNYPS